MVLSTSAQYATLQLVATPRNARQEPLSGLPAALYRSTDPDKVAVSDDGMLIALGRTTQPVAVVATLTANNLKHTDTVVVSVVDDPAPPVLANFSVHPLPLDSAKIGARMRIPAPVGLDTLPVQASTADGDAIPTYPQDNEGYLPIYFQVSDSTIARISRNFPELLGIRPGTVTVYASTTAFGVAKADTLVYQVGWPVLAQVNILSPAPEKYWSFLDPRWKHDRFSNTTPDIRIGVGGVVLWLALYWEIPPLRPETADTVDITFDDADLPNVAAVRPVYDLLQRFGAQSYYCVFDCDNGGNFAVTTSEQRVARRFTAPGTYEYRSLRKGMSGRIIVVDEHP